MIWYDNLVLNSKIEIPCSDKEIFKFEYIWEYSITLRFDPENVIIENLYCLLQSYLWNKDLRCLKVYTGFLDKNNKKILNYSNVFIIKKMNFIYFNDWWENILNHDKIYLQDSNKEIYGIIICFSKSSLKEFANENKIKKEEIVNLRPIFPWKKEITDHVKFFK